MNGVSDRDETYREYSLAAKDDLIRFWRSKVKVTAGGEGIRLLVERYTYGRRARAHRAVVVS